MRKERMRSLVAIALVMFLAISGMAQEPKTGAASVAVAGSTGETFTYTDLIGRLTDLEVLAVLPKPGEKCREFSSYDRRSRYDEATGKYVDWDANGDGGGIIRKEGDLSVFAEMEGPGVIWRIWTATTTPEGGKGHVKIFLDGLSEPAVDLPFKKFIDGTEAPFQGQALCYQAPCAYVCYVPIPFQKSCKIVGEPNWGGYYQFTYTTYPKDTKVPTFKRDVSADEKQALAKVNEFLEKNVGNDPAGTRAGEKVDEKTLAVEPGKTALVVELTGPRAITAIRVKMDLPPSPADRDILRELCLRITWDDDAKPSVWSPLGDFFGSAPGYNEYRTLPLGMTKDGFYSFWYMPFAKKAKIELVNDGKEPRKVQFAIMHAPLTRPVETLGRFHAKWHRDAFLPEEPERRAIDWTMLKTSGKGRFVGVMLHVWNALGGWWGEGDEKFFVDNEKFPSSFGTGSEDYFGYGWCQPARFAYAYHAQTHVKLANGYYPGCIGSGHSCMNRWHITDNVPFQAAFEADIEKYFPNRRLTLYAATVYWYQQAGGVDAYPELPLGERVGWYTEPRCAPGVFEMESLKKLEFTSGCIGLEEWEDPDTGEVKTVNSRAAPRFKPGGWSGNMQMLWRSPKIGARWTVALPVSVDGKHKIAVRLTGAEYSYTVQILLDDQNIGAPIDLSASIDTAKDYDLGIHELKAGEHKLTINVVGGNAKVQKHEQWGLVGVDCIKLERVP